MEKWHVEQNSTGIPHGLTEQRGLLITIATKNRTQLETRSKFEKMSHEAAHSLILLNVSN